MEPHDLHALLTAFGFGLGAFVTVRSLLVPLILGLIDRRP